MRKIILLGIVALCSCSTSKYSADNLRTMDFGTFTIRGPKEWKKTKIQGIDANVGRIEMFDNEHSGFNMGFFSPTLEKQSQYDDKTLIKNNITSTIIDGYKAKVAVSKSHDGITGIRIDSLWKVKDDDYDIVKFILMGQNLNEKNKAALLTAIKTLKFYKDKPFKP
jgi:hypothetical protein